MVTLQKLLSQLKLRGRKVALPTAPTSSDIEQAFQPQCHCTEDEFYGRHLYDVAGHFDAKLPKNL